MLRWLQGVTSSDVAIDLGTSNTLVYVRGRGIVVNEPSVVAVRDGAHREPVFLRVGKEAKDMLGRTPGDIRAVRPIKDGVIADFDATGQMLRFFITKALGRSIRMRLRIVCCVPVGITEVEKRAVRDAAETAAAREVYLVEEPMAAAVGAGLPVSEPSGIMVVDIGGGTTEAAVISLEGIVFSRSIRVAGDKMDDAVIAHVKRKYSLLIGDRTAELIKMRIGSAYPSDDLLTMEVKGRDLVAGIPKTVEINSDEVREALAEPVNAIVESIRVALERTPPELAADIVDRGIVLTGGGALLTDLDRLISNETGLPVLVADDPLTVVAMGAGKMLEEIELLRRVSVA